MLIKPGSLTRGTEKFLGKFETISHVLLLGERVHHISRGVYGPSCPVRIRNHVVSMVGSVFLFIFFKMNPGTVEHSLKYV